MEVNYASAVGSAEFVTENWRRLDRQTTSAAARATQEGAEQSGVVYFDGQDNMLPTTSSGADPSPMCAYQLDAAQFTSLRATMRIHGITWERSAGGGALVTMAQPDQPLIPLLFDARRSTGSPRPPRSTSAEPGPVGRGRVTDRFATPSVSL